MANLRWIKGMESPNKSGRPKGTQITIERRLDRLIELFATEKEFKVNLKACKPGAEKLYWIMRIVELRVPKAIANGIDENKLDDAIELLKNKASEEQKKTG